MLDKQLIKQEIEKLRETNGFLPLDNHEICDAYRARGYQLACDDILQFIDSIPEEPASKDLEDEITKCYKSRNDLMMTRKQFGELIHHFADWQRKKDQESGCKSGCEINFTTKNEDLEKASQEYAENHFQDFIETEDDPGYWCSRFGFIAGAEWQKQQMKEVLQTEYEKGRFDMREEMMKALVNGEIVKNIHNQLSVKSEPINDAFKDVKFGDKIKIIIVKED